MWSWSTNVTDGRTDGRTTCNLNTALCTSASRGKNKTEKSTRSRQSSRLTLTNVTCDPWFTKYFSSYKYNTLDRKVPNIKFQKNMRKGYSLFQYPPSACAEGPMPHLLSPWNFTAPKTNSMDVGGRRAGGRQDGMASTCGPMHLWCGMNRTEQIQKWSN